MLDMRACSSCLRLALQLTAALILTFPSPSEAATARGYQARACGLDMNRNGIVGEPADCQVCDGSTVDPDGDGTAEDMIYIDCGSGVDSPACGSPGFPCRTIEYAWETRADGAQDGAEDILCFRGVCTTEEDLSPGVSGVAGHYTLAASGSQERAWQFPRNPTMLVGWDEDDDGAYPPFDSDDTAVLDGGANNLRRAFWLNENGVRSYLEMAHFTARDYGRFSSTTDNRGFLKAGQIGPESSHVYLHDLELLRINRDLGSQSSTSVFNLFRGGTQPQWWAFVNLEVSEIGSWFTRGSAQNEAASENGPYRFQNLTVTGHGCDEAICGTTASLSMFKLWGYVSRIEILDSVFDLNVDAWQPVVGGGNPSGGINAAQCSRQWTIRNNVFIDFKRVLKVQADDDGCGGAEARTTDDIVLDRNVLRNTFAWGNGDPVAEIAPGLRLNQTVARVTLSNNFFSTTHPWVACIWSQAGNNQGVNPGTITIVGNTCHGDIDRYAGLVIGDPEDGGTATLFPQQSYTFKNNIFAALDGDDLNVRSTHPLLAMDADSNVYDADARFVWSDGLPLSLAQWQVTSNGDGSSRLCTPQFFDAAGGNLHLRLRDECARDAGEAVAAAVDFDGEPRGFGDGWDIGADEVGAQIFASDFEGGDSDDWRHATGW